MNAIQRLFYFSAALSALSSCASFENLSDDRTRAEDDEMYWNGKELFYDNSIQASVAGAEDDYYDPTYANRSNSISGGTNPRASFNPISGWQLSYGLNTFSNYGMSYGAGYNTNYGVYPYGNNSYGYNSYGYNSFNSYNPYGGYGYNPYSNGSGGIGWGNGFGGYNNGGFQNGVGGSSGSGETSNVTHHHRRPVSVNSGNNSSYNQGVLRKNLIQPISESSKAPQQVMPSRWNTSNDYSKPSYSRPMNNSDSNRPSNSTPSQGKTNYSRPQHSNDEPIHRSPSQSHPSNSSPTRSTSTPSSPSRSTPAPSSPSRSSSPGKRP
jgi:hypothetical protein